MISWLAFSAMACFAASAFFVRLGRLGKITQEFLAFGCNEFGQIVRADLRQQNIRAL